MPSDWCSHGRHDGPCGFKYTETSCATPPTGIVTTLLVAVCQCEGWHD